MKLLDYLLDWILPNRCGFCGDFIKWDELACQDCINEIEYPDNYIKYDDQGCFSACVYACEYRDVAKQGVLNLKYHKNINSAKYLLPRLITNLKSAGIADKIDIVTAVPMHASRLNKTGYNHAQIIADMVSKCLNIDKDHKLLGVTRSKGTQHELSREDRMIAVKGRYFIKSTAWKKVYGKTVLLCDDVITTGSTLSECSRLLLQAGADKVYCLALASTNYKEGN